MQTKITLNLPARDYSALVRMANEELRNPRAQLLYILQKEARARGLVTQDKELGLENTSEGRNNHAPTTNNEG